MSKTDGVCLNAAGHRLDEDPVPILYVGPTKSNIDSVIEPRVAQMIESVPTLKAALVRGRKSKKLVKKLNGVTFRMAWAGSATELASQPAAMVIVDEVDRMENVVGEGDVVSLSEARMATYPDSLLILDSSPTIGSVDTYTHPVTGMEHWKHAHADDIQSPIWWYFQEGTCFEWAVPCQFCNRYFIPRFKYLWWPKGATAMQATREGMLICPNCGERHGENLKDAMNSRGTFLAPGQFVDENRIKQGEYEPNDIVSFWVSGLMSPWVSFGQSAAKWIRACNSGETAQIQAVLNTRFGELFKFKGEAPPWESVQKCSNGLKMGVIPAFVQRIYMTVDVQKDRLICLTRGWGYQYESVLIEFKEIFGQTDQQGVWDELQALIFSQYSGRSLDQVAIDSGFRANQVYAFVQKFPAMCVATKGIEDPRRIYSASDIEVDIEGKKSTLSIKLWMVDTGYFKTWVHDRINQETKNESRWWIPADATEDYCRQIVAEHRMALASGKVRWIRAHKENHALDCESLQIFLANMRDVRYLEPIEMIGKKKSMAEMAAELNG